MAENSHERGTAKHAFSLRSFNIKYRDCEYFPDPVIENGLEVFAVMRIHRQKVQKKEASRVAIPITEALKRSSKHPGRTTY